MVREFVPYPFTPIRHEPVLPDLRAGTDVQRRTVVVVGGGPVGLCTALGLANQGIPVVLLEADESVCIGSRAICISRRSLEILERLGVLPAFLRIGLPWTGGRSFYREAEVLKFSMPVDENQKLPPMINIAQYDIEQILVDRAAALGPRIDIRWGSRVTGIEPGPSGVRLNVATSLGGYSIEADWVIAADGGRGFVREALGLKMQGTRYEGRYVIVDILLPSDRPTERLAYFDPTCNPGSTVLVHKQPNDVWRIDYQLRDGEDPDAAVRPENVLPRVESLLSMMGETAPWAPIWIGLYKASALTLPQYRCGRVLFAGDAAHLVPIFGVRGANSGIDDADNLSWKLSHVIKGIAAESLLDSYSTERVAAAHENLTSGAKSTEFMAPPSFAFEWMRTAVLSLAVKHPGVRSLINPRQTAAIRYAVSPLNAPGSASTGGPVVGSVLPECPVTYVRGQEIRVGYLTDVLGLDPVNTFTLLWLCEEADMPAGVVEFVNEWNSRGVSLKWCSIGRRSPVAPAPPAHWAGFDHTGRLFPLFGATGERLMLLRPDGHIAGVWLRFDAAVVAAGIRHVLGMEER